MNQTTKTGVFVAAGLLSLAAAWGTHVATQPRPITEFGPIGAEFFEDFTDPLKATALQVAAYNDDASRVDLFKVEKKNNLWRIPSHYDYPADGQDRLAKTATSMLGITRGALVSTSDQDHKRLGVLDPLDEKLTGTEGRGDRITLFEGDKRLVDLIVGKKVEGQQDLYYVRKVGENQVYRTELKGLDISTKFAQWIEPDLLKLDRMKLTEMVVDRYSVDQLRGAIEQGDRIKLTRNPTTDPWKLEGLDEAAEKVKTGAVNAMMSSLDDLKIVGVRPKPAGLTAQLKGSADRGLSEIEAMEMAQRGFYLTRGNELVSNEGEVQAGTTEGVRYILRFGAVFTGSDVDIEVGKPAGEGAATEANPTEGDAKPSTTEAKVDADPATPAADADSADTDKPDGDSDSQKKSRYVFITVHFDESLVGEPPQPPVKPEPPAAEPSADEKKPEGDATSDEPKKPESDGSADSSAAAQDPTKAPEDATRDEPAKDGAEKKEDADQKPDDDDEKKPDPQAEYDAALKKYEADQKEFERKQKDHEQKIEDGKKRVKELNDRFAAWYYVISADLFEDLHVSRKDLVEPKDPLKTTDAADTAPGAGTATEEQKKDPPPSDPGAKPEGDSNPDAAPKSETDAKPESKPDEAKSETP
jgi:hypothetical protein